MTATAIAALARSKLNADIGIGLDEYVSSEGNTLMEDSPLSRVFIAVDMGRGNRNIIQDFSWRSNQLARRANYQALFTLRNLLLSW